MRTASIHITQPVCSSFMDSELPYHSYASLPPISAEDESESRSSGQTPPEMFKEEWGFMKEEEMESKIGKYYGFVLKMVDASGMSCIACHWLNGCTGCVIVPDDTPLNCLTTSRKIAVDWESDFLKDHFHQILYENTVAHWSVESEDATGKQNILLEECLDKFVQTEILQDEQKLRCDHVGAAWISLSVVQALHEPLAVSADLAHAAHPGDPLEAVPQQLARVHQAAVQRGVPAHRLRYRAVHGRRDAERGVGGSEVLGIAGRAVQFDAEGEHAGRFDGEKREEVGGVRGAAHESRLSEEGDRA